MRTHYENWGRESILGLILSTAVVLLPTAGCGAALLVQVHTLNAHAAANIDECTRQAGAAANEEQQFGACIDDRGFADMAVKLG